MSVVDVVILALVAGLAALGWRGDGLVRAIWAFVGTLVGTGPRPRAGPPRPRRRRLVDLGRDGRGRRRRGLRGSGAVRPAVGGAAGARARLGWTPPERFDHAGGLAFGVATALGISWALGLALAGSTFPNISASANGSVALQALDRAPMPLTTG